MNSNTFEQCQVLYSDCKINSLPLFDEKILYSTQKSKFYREKLEKLNDCNMILIAEHDIKAGNSNTWKRIFRKASSFCNSLFLMAIPKNLQSVPPPERRLYY